MNKHEAVVYSEGKLSHKFLALLTYIWERYLQIVGGVQLQLWGHAALGKCLSGWDTLLRSVSRSGSRCLSGFANKKGFPSNSAVGKTQLHLNIVCMTASSGSAADSNPD